MALIDNLETMLRRGQDNALVRYGLGNEYLKLKQLDKAVTHLQKAVELDPAYSAAWKQLGKALVASARTAEAVAAYEAGIQAADQRGDVQAAKEMRVFLRRLTK